MMYMHLNLVRTVHVQHFSLRTSPLSHGRLVAPLCTAQGQRLGLGLGNRLVLVGE